MILNAGIAYIELIDGAIRKVNSQDARGEDVQPSRKLTYEAARLAMLFTERGEMEKLTGEQNARLISESDTALTTITSDRVDLEFATHAKTSTLHKALANGKATVESRPVQRKGAAPQDTRILRSETIELEMRPGGEEIDNVTTHAPGTIEFLPNRPNGRRRTMDGDRIWITYGRQNVIDSFRSVSVSTRTEPDPNVKPPGAPQLTWSKDMKAEFDPKTGQLARLEQWNDFRYEEGARHARAAKAAFEPAQERIVLEGSARVWDPSGVTSGDQIFLNQKTGDFSAQGKVASTRQPEKKKGASAGMLSGDAPLQARAQKMRTSDGNRQISYEGEAVLWQGSNRIEANRVDIDRSMETLQAAGNVTSSFLDTAAPKGKKKQTIARLVRGQHRGERGRQHAARRRADGGQSRAGHQRRRGGRLGD
jgi:lipopolysaccharide export system protein LptA